MAIRTLASNQIDLFNRFISNADKEFSIVVDMTLGNGNDAKKILTTFPDCFLLGFDIQQEAIDRSLEKLKDICNQNFKLVKDSHENIDKYISQADLIVYNLGYLPGGNKKITSQASSTLKSLQKSLQLLSVSGIISLTFYLGHEEGRLEYNSCIDYIKSLNQKDYTVIQNTFINQVNNPPVSVYIERLR